LISDEQIDQLKNNKITKVRVYTSEGYAECDVKEKDAEKVIKALELLN